mgnify:CR=1 FL=1
MDLRFVQDSIFDLSTDSIIYFTDNTLIGPSSKFLVDKASKKIIEPIIKQNGCPTGKAKIIPGFDLKNDYVILAVIPDGLENDRDKFLFKQTIYNIFDLMTEYNLNSIAVDLSHIYEIYGKNYVTLLNEVIIEKRNDYIDLVMYLCKGNVIDN